jgi:hypothetical protein
VYLEFEFPTAGLRCGEFELVLVSKIRISGGERKRRSIRALEFADVKTEGKLSHGKEERSVSNKNVRVKCQVQIESR